MVALKVPSEKNVTVNPCVVKPRNQGPFRALNIVCRFVPPVELPEGRVAKAVAEIVQSRPAPFAVALLGSSPIHRFPLASETSKLVLAGTNEKLEAFPPVRSAPPMETKVNSCVVGT